MKVHVGRNKGFYKAYIQGNEVQKIETSDSGRLMVRLCPLVLRRTNDAAYDHQIGFFTPINVDVSEVQEDTEGCMITLVLNVLCSFKLS
jgi:hypothetical protein